MRNGHACPISGGSEMYGNSGESVSVRSTTLILPAARPLARSASALMPLHQMPVRRCAMLPIGSILQTSCRELLFQRFRIVAPSGEPFLRDIAGIQVFHPFAQRLDHGAGEKGWKTRSEEHTSELQSLTNLVCRLLLE